MSRKRVIAHGATVAAPNEDYSVDDSPEPSAVKDRPGRNRAVSVPAGEPRGGVAQLVAAVKLGAGLAVVIGVAVAVAYSVHRYALTTPRFALKTVELVGAKRLTQARIEQLGGLEKGKNLFALDTEAAERKILEDPWVGSVRITRELPTTLKVEITERDAVAVAAIGDRIYLVTSEGEPFKLLDSDDPSDLPVITGIGPEELARDRARALERLKTALSLIKQYEKQPSSRINPVEEVHLAPSGDVVLTVGKEGIALELGREPFARKLAMAEEVLSNLRRKGKAPGVVFLDNQAHPERVVVRMK
jgi:cell division protein FtsQ